MKYFKKTSAWLFLILLIDYGNSPATGQLGDKDTLRANKIILQTVLDFGGKFLPELELLSNAWKAYDGYVEGQSDPLSSTNNKLDKLADSVSKLSEDVKYYHNNLYTTIKELGLEISLQNKIESLYDLIASVETSAQSLRNVLNVKSHRQSDIDVELNEMLNVKRISNALTDMTSRIIGNTFVDDNIIQLTLHPNLKFTQICKRKASVQQILYNHYRFIHGSQVLGLWLIIYANLKITKKEQEEANRRSAIQIALANHFRNMAKITAAFSEPISVATRDMWRCDPDGSAEEGISYERFGRSFQKYLFNTRNYYPKPVRGSALCNKSNNKCEDLGAPEKKLYEVDRGWGSSVVYRNEASPPDYTVANYSNDRENWSLFMHKDIQENRCFRGKLKNCKTIEDNSLTVCPARPGSVERYTYIKGNDNNWIYGSGKFCHTTPQTLQRPTEFTSDYSAGYLCNYCMCTCEYDVPDAGNYAYQNEKLAALETDRYIHTDPVSADAGHVVTGVRWTKDKTAHTFHLQIKQAKLLPMGRVSKSYWKNINYLTGSFYPFELMLDRNRNPTEAYEEGEEYHKIKADNTLIYLDSEPLAQPGEVLTGVWFNEQDKNEETGKTHLVLSSILSRFNFTTGIIEGDSTVRKTVNDTIDRTPVQIDECDVPTKYNGLNKVMSDRYNYVELTNTALKFDVGQNIIPFLDIQEVDTFPAMPLVGVSLYHRGFKDSGGYIGLKAHILNLKSYLPDFKTFERKAEEISNAEAL